MNGLPDNPEALLRERAWLGALARQLVKRGELADEAAHDALSAAVTQPGPRSAGVRGWLAAILKRQLAGRRRADHRRLLREQLAARPESVPSVAATVVHFEAQRAVADAVLALGEPYRTAVLLRFWDGLSPGAIGRQLGVPVETVRTRLKRGLTMLRERLDREHGGDRQAWLVPVWLAGRRTGSAVASFWMGVLLMTTMQKLFVGGVALAAAAMLWLSMPWLRPGRPVPVAATHEPAPIAVLGRADGDAAVADEREARIDRVAMASTIPSTGLLVKGRLVDDETGAALAGLPVRWLRWMCWPRGDEPEVEAVSAFDGEFVLADPRPTEQRPRELLVQVPQFALAHVRVNPARDQEGAQEVDVGTIRLVRGTLFSGQVVDPDGRGVPGAQLLLPMVRVYYGGFGPQNMLERSVHLGAGEADGRFRLLHAIAPGSDHGNLLFAVAPHSIGWCRIEPSKQRRDVTDLVVRLRPAGALRVAVQKPDGQPAAGVMVRAMPRFGPIGVDKDGLRTEVAADELVGARFCGRTDERGELQLQHLPTGEPNPLLDQRAEQRRYELWVEADGFPEQPLTPVELQPGAEARVAVRLLASRQIVVTARVRDDLGAPIADAVVTCLAAVARTDASGQATLSVEALPELGLWASCEGHWRQHESLEPGTNSAAEVTLVLPRVRPLEGRVVDQLGAGAAGMNLFVEQRKVGVTDADGRFQIAEFPLGPRPLIVATAVGMDPQWTGEQTPETVDAGAGPVTIVLQRRLGSVDVRCTVVDAATGSGLEPVESMLSLRDEESGHYHVRKLVETERSVITAKGSPAGRWRLDVVTATGHRGSLVFEVTEGQPATELRLELQAPGTILGRLQFGSLTPPATVTLHVAHGTLDPTAFVQFRHPGDWHPDPETQTVTDNRFGGTGDLRMQPLRNASFRLDSVDPTDELVFRVRGEGITGQATLRVGPGQTRELSIELRPQPATRR